jgi:hypothetical protein
LLEARKALLAAAWEGEASSATEVVLSKKEKTEKD